jgi:hypothetical protein
VVHDSLSLSRHRAERQAADIPGRRGWAGPLECQHRKPPDQKRLAEADVANRREDIVGVSAKRCLRRDRVYMRWLRWRRCAQAEAAFASSNPDISRAALGHVISARDRLARLVQQLLLLARVEEHAYLEIMIRNDSRLSQCGFTITVNCSRVSTRAQSDSTLQCKVRP